MTYPPGSDPYGNPTPRQPDSPGWGQSGGYRQAPDAGWGQTGNAHPAYQQPQPGYQQPGYPPPGDAQPGWQQQPGRPAQPGYPGAGFPPPRRNNTVLIAAGVAGAVVLVVIVGALVVVLNRHTGNDTTASPASPSLVPATSSSATTTSPATSSPSHSGRFSYTEYSHDWNFSLDGVHLHADWVSGQDHPACGDIENGGKLTGLGCQYAAEMVYRAENGAVMLTQYVLGTSDTADARKLASRYADDDLKMRPGTYIDHFAVGKWQTKAQGDFVVLTVVTATNAVTEDTATKYMHYVEADMTGALLFR